MLPVSPLLSWFFTLFLLLLAGRATARLVLARGSAPTPSTAPAAAPGSPGAAPGLSGAQRRREFGHAAMGLGMAVLLVPGLPRPPLAASVCFFAALAALAAFDWVRRLLPGRRGHAADSCVPRSEGGHLLDPHHAIVGVAMVVMLVCPLPSGGSATHAAAMPGMVMGTGATPGATVLILLGYVWLAALVLGYGMTRVLAAAQAEGATVPATGTASGALLSSPATVYACELAMTVLTGLMLLS